jgi:probable F420-dependent oxidoreductase
MTVDWTAADTRRFVLDVEDAGVDFVTVSGHVLSSRPGRHAPRPDSVYVGPFHDPLVLFAHLCAITERVRFRSSLLILPLHPTVVVAAAIAELCDLSGGRFELGVGISWNVEEYRAAGQDFHRRGRRLDEQLDVLRALWTHERVTFEGEFHHLDDIGVGRLPERPPRIWIGGTMVAANLSRLAKHADGWLPLGGDPTPHLPTLRDALAAAGRDPEPFSVNARLDLSSDEPAWVADATRFAAAGVSHLVLDPGPGRSSAESGTVVRRAVEVLGPLAAGA